MNVLAVDSSTESLVVALRAGSRFYGRCLREGLRHAQTLAPQIEQVLAQAALEPRQLDLVVAGVGPGSFTGLRIALATARGLARGAACPLVGVATLDAIAWPLQAWPGIVVPVLDARKDRVYAALYRDGGRVSDFLDATVEELAAAIGGRRPALLTGPYARQAGSAAALAGCTVDPWHEAPDGAGLVELGLAARSRGEGTAAAPVYLRRSEAEQAKG